MQEGPETATVHHDFEAVGVLEKPAQLDRDIDGALYRKGAGRDDIG